MSDMSTDSQAVAPARKPYVQPTLREWGSLIDLTQVGVTSSQAKACGENGIHGRHGNNGP